MSADPKLSANDFSAIGARLREIEREKAHEPTDYPVTWTSSWGDGAWRRRPEMPTGSAEVGGGLWRLPDGRLVKPTEVEAYLG